MTEPPANPGSLADRKREAGILLLAVGMCGVVFIFDLLTPLGVAAATPYTVVILLGFGLPRQRGILMLAGLCTALTLAGLAFSPGGVDQLWKVVLNRSMAAMAIWVIAFAISMQKQIEARREQAVRDREQALREREQAQSEAKVLRGLLPICASCKRIRDEQGQWKQVETYIQQHSEADFSHGLCPDCVKKLYPEYSI